MTDSMPMTEEGHAEQPITLSEMYAALERRIGSDRAHALIALYNLEVLQESAKPLTVVDPFTLEFADKMRAWTHLSALLALTDEDLVTLAAEADVKLRAMKVAYRARDN